jgi:hypothetical protein
MQKDSERSLFAFENIFWDRPETERPRGFRSLELSERLKPGIDGRDPLVHLPDLGTEVGIRCDVQLAYPCRLMPFRLILFIEGSAVFFQPFPFPEEVGSPGFKPPSGNSSPPLAMHLDRLLMETWEPLQLPDYK